MTIVNAPSPLRRRAAWKKPRAARAAPSAQDAALLDAAALEFNARGVAGARLAQIAKAIGVRRAALYYYVDSREELAYRCYARACQTSAQDLSTARAAGGTGLAQLERYLRLALDPARAPAVVLSEIAYLSGAHRAAIEAAHRANLRQLRALIETGMSDSSMRRCDAQIISQAIFGMVSWVPLAGEYVTGTGPELRAHAAEALCDLLENGVASDPSLNFHCPLDFSAFTFRPGNMFKRADASAHKIELLLQTATRLFNQRGIDGTSLDDLTAELGATKGAFYHHLPEKRALVVRCVQRAFDFYERFADAAQAIGGNGLQRAFIGLHLNVQAQASAQAPLSPLTGVEDLPPRVLRGIRERAARINARFESFNRQGLADGSLRRFDIHTLVLAGAGAFGWIPKWHDPADGLEPRVIADEIVDLFAHGLGSVNNQFMQTLPPQKSPGKARADAKAEAFARRATPHGDF